MLIYLVTGDFNLDYLVEVMLGFTVKLLFFCFVIKNSYGGSRLKMAV